jgi:hypothetical protein
LLLIFFKEELRRGKLLRENKLEPTELSHSRYQFRHSKVGLNKPYTLAEAPSQKESFLLYKLTNE